MLKKMSKASTKVEAMVKIVQKPLRPSITSKIVLMDSIARAGSKEITIMEIRIANSFAGFAPMAVSEEQELQCKGVDLMVCETKNSCALLDLERYFFYGDGYFGFEAACDGRSKGYSGR